MMEKRLVHDYPRLAKESGFNFSFRFKRVNWSKLDELDVEEIAFRGKYEQLEESIDLILNCDLDEDVTKVLDKNFVKLFRLAQISVGYLRHCMLYLDQCVVLLQDKLSNALRQTAGLNILAKDETDGFECEKCQKVFLTTSYLTAHQKRRHMSPEKTAGKSVATQTESIKSLTINSEQQTDPTRTFIASTQTSFPKMFEKGVMTEVLQGNTSANEDYKEKLDTVLKRLEAVEAKSEQPLKISEENDENKQILQYLKNLMPLLTATTEEKNSLQNELEHLNQCQTCHKKIEDNQPLLIDLDEPPPKLEKIMDDSVNTIVLEEIPIITEKPLEKPRPRRKKIASPSETSEDESIQLPVPKPRASTVHLPEKREAFVLEKPEKKPPLRQAQLLKNSPKLITFSPEKDTLQVAEKTELTLNEKIDRKMRELGLDPEWTRLPDDSFKNVMSVLQHQIQKNPILARQRHIVEIQLESMIEGKKEMIATPAENKPLMYDTDTDKESEEDWHDIQVHEILGHKPPLQTIEHREQKSVETAQETQVEKLTFETRPTAPAKEDYPKSLAFPVKTTDLSIFQVTANEKPETDSDESEPIKMKSSLLIKNKDEPKKRVVFADNFVLETIHDELLDIDNQSSSSSNSWDLQTP